jgi:predicted DNA repair protein MutK
MAGGSLLVLLDDIATVLDDVATMTKLATKKTAGVLGDDLAVNAEQASGVRAERELPVVWAVAKGSFRNKCILVPLALLVSVVAPWLITPALIVGGLFLCYEGFEKIAHRFLHSSAEDAAHREELVAHRHDLSIDLVQLEKDKIKGAVRTDFILSAEIIVLTLGLVAGQDLLRQVLVLTVISLVMTVGVYGLVAGIVKLDDAGLYLMRRDGEGVLLKLQRWLGARVLDFAPLLMKFLGFAGTVAMLLVGGGILVHGFHGLHDLVADFTANAARTGTVGSVLAAVSPMLANLSVGMLAGAVVVALVELWKRLRSPVRQ